MEIQEQNNEKSVVNEKDQHNSELKHMENAVREYIDLVVKAETDPDEMVRKIASKIVDLETTKEKADTVRQIVGEKASEYIMGRGIGTQTAIANAVERDYAPLVITAARQFIGEYECKTSSEKAMAEVAAMAYVRIIQWSEMCSKAFKNGAHKDTTALFSLASKELDRANRHFESSLSMLKQMKMPAINMKIHTKNAFIADKQQFNNVQENNESK